MGKQIDAEQLRGLLLPLGFIEEQGTKEEALVFWRRLENRDLRSPFAFSHVRASLDQYVFRLEAWNQGRLKKAAKADLIVLESPEDLEPYKEIILEKSRAAAEQLPAFIGFFAQQMQALEEEKLSSPIYKAALKNLELMAQAANQVDLE
ncbi:hypothetical protein [Saprospira grandis]|uniref:Uncharacterized protein n=2 Tax=Saprospira grandis TaxID=1008 RepID=H6LA67_SAPGL|nr:hypothetical protein [Saprospira grandis]AFC25535.1 hypothetical protein SGRA_2807 [Saprospira grandis str. Lewin]EJF53884.1 hypothetical protein SapgrDRAFT_2208 [Saprospira grandis DSM 2844]